MAGVFISHSAEDTAIVRNFVDLIAHGIGLGKEDIFCTSVPGQIAPGSDFKAEIKARLNSSSLFLPIISESFSTSRFCMFELGASWAASKSIIPILVPPLTYSDMAPVLQDTQAVRIENELDLSLMRSEICRLMHLQKSKEEASWRTMKRRFLRSLSQALPRRETWIYAIRNTRPEGLHEVIGCFQTHRVANRQNVIVASGRAYWARPSCRFVGSGQARKQSLGLTAFF